MFKQTPLVSKSLAKKNQPREEEFCPLFLQFTIYWVSYHHVFYLPMVSCKTCVSRASDGMTRSLNLANRNGKPGLENCLNWNNSKFPDALNQQTYQMYNSLSFITSQTPRVKALEQFRISDKSTGMVKSTVP